MMNQYSRLKVTLFLLLLSVISTSSAETVITSFEFTANGTFSIGTSPNTAIFTGGQSKTIGNAAYYHSGVFSWHVSSGTAVVSFETNPDSIDFWYRDTAGATPSAVRIFDENSVMLTTITGTQSFQNIVISRSSGQSKIGRVELVWAGNADAVIDDFSFTTTEIVDSTPPIITLNGDNPMSLEVGTAYEDPGATAEDNIDGDISSTIVIDASAVDTDIIGSYSVTFNVSDAAGNAAPTMTRTVNVVFSPSNPIAESIDTGSIEIMLNEVSSGFELITAAIPAPGHENYLYILDQIGTITALELSSGTKTLILDISSRLIELGIAGPDTYDERGLLGIAFHPDFQSNGLIYTHTSEVVTDNPDFTSMQVGEVADHQTVIIEWQSMDATDPVSMVDPASARVLMKIDQPQFNHNGGALAFDSNNLLYIAIGDGGNADDEGPGHGESGNGRNINNVMGSILRIDPLANDSANTQYGIPATNPFIGMTGVDEIFAYGFRNPFRFSFDSNTGDLWVADLGQNSIEEIDKVTSGNNYGWNYKEGSFFFEGNEANSGTVTDVDPGVPSELVDPIAEYDHDEGIAVIGGYVYHGMAIGDLEGLYVFGDYGSFDGSVGYLYYLDSTNKIFAFDNGSDGVVDMSVTGFAQDSSGELYVLANSTGIPSGETGVILKIEPIPEPPPPAPPPPPRKSGGGIVHPISLLFLLAIWIVVVGRLDYIVRKMN